MDPRVSPSGTTFLPPGVLWLWGEHTSPCPSLPESVSFDLPHLRLPFSQKQATDVQPLCNPCISQGPVMCTAALHR